MYTTEQCGSGGFGDIIDGVRTSTDAFKSTSGVFSFSLKEAFPMSKIVDRFLRYASIDTQSDEDSTTAPSTQKQFDLARVLVDELRELGVSNVRLDEKYCNVYGEIPSNLDNSDEAPALGFISHMDTSPAAPGDASNAQIHQNYDGGVIQLNENVSLDPAIYPELLDYIGQDLIVTDNIVLILKHHVVTDGISLLGGDDKAGIAEIMTLAERLLNDPSIKHGRIGIAFTSDEEIGHGTDHFDIDGFNMDYAYTVDGGPLGELAYENFNAAAVLITINGRDIHPGAAKDIMVNAARIACELDMILPQEQRPEHTDHYEGFFHLCRMEGCAVSAEMRYIIRDHDAGLFGQKLQLLRDCVDYLNAKYYGAVTLEITEQYRNMRELIEPHMFLIDNAKAAFEACGVTPVVIPIRGGTDGARLTYNGLPCPNLSSGGLNYHSNTEYLPVQSLEKMADVLVELVTVK